MKLCVLGSGSKGNSVLMQAGSTRVLIDAGFSTRAMSKRLGAINVDPESIEAVIITHEHDDHAKGAVSCAKKWGWQIYATEGTRGASLGLADAATRSIASNASIEIGDLEIRTVSTSHDAEEPIAVVATGKPCGVRAAIVYDLGVVTETISRALDRVEILILESNYDGEMLRTGPYPVSVQRRIAGREGHLSNRSAALAAAACSHSGLAHVVLAHLSEVNNTPRLALETMERVLKRTTFRGQITPGAQDVPSRTIAADRSRNFAACQLSLGL
ncbi:MAG: MBL fold metallo-hydrolase [Gemmatimonadaceae bacterium]